MNGDLLERIDAYLAGRKISEGRFGQLACNNARLVERLRNGGRIWPETEEKVREFISKHPEPAE